ncbi:hypothetical protein ACGF12_36825 [Kitasatospora sp. NPDC048296]|uniref:hypothetical protein n=1 Tax=Kitasatospora sp. NPDC048296 TaxID=3364048 RepID=UPI00371D97FB
MKDRKGLWERVLGAGPEKPWFVLAAALLFWTGLLVNQAFMVFTGRTDHPTAVISLFLLPFGVLHAATAIVHKLRGNRGSRRG